MSGIFHKGLILTLSVGLSLALATWSRARQELRAVTVANEGLRKTLGEMTVAITEKERQIDRLSQMPCSTPSDKTPAANQGTSDRKLAQTEGADR